MAVGEKQATQAQPDTKRDIAGFVVTGGTLLAAFCLAATVGYLLSLTELLGASTLQVGLQVTAHPGALAIGAGLGAAFFWLFQWKLRARMRVFKAGQGRWTRVVAYVAVGAMAVFGAWVFYQYSFPSSSPWELSIWQADLFGKMLAIKPVLFPSVGIFLTALLVAHLYLNRSKPADFLIETEGEIRKVAWPARKEYLGSSAVVVVVIIILSLYLFAVDKTLSELLVKWLKVGF